MLGLIKLKGAGKAEKVAGPEETGRLFLCVSETGWEARHFEPGKPPAQKQGPAVVATAHEQPLETFYANQFKEIAEEYRRYASKMGAVHVLLDDPDVVLSDTRSEVFTGASESNLRTHGQQVLRVDAVTFGSAPFGPSPPKEQARPGNVIAFANARRTSAYLGRIEQFANKVASITPIADMLVRRADAAGEAYCGIYFGATRTQLVVANPIFGTIVSRALPFGMFTLIQRIAEGYGISLEEAEETLVGKDMLSNLNNISPISSVETMTRSAAERILSDDLYGFFDQVKETLSFFEAQRIAGRPEAVELYGKLAGTKGMAKLVARHLPLTVKPQGEALFDVFCRTAPEARLNLLQGAAGEIRIGTVRYSFRADIGKLERYEEAKRDATVTPVAGRSTVRESRERLRNRSGRRRARGGGVAEAGFLANLFPSLAGGGEGARGAAPAEGSPSTVTPRQRAQYFALFGVLALALAWMGYQELSLIEMRAASSVSAFEGAVTSGATLSQQLAQVDNVAVTPQEGVDKVLWTEKFLAIGDQLTDEVWITDLFLETAQRRTAAGSTLQMKKLVMLGAAHPSTDGHVLKIADFVENLEDEQTYGFMADFRDITFEGAAIDESGETPVIRFALAAWYDEAKRLEEQRRTQARRGSGGVDAVVEADRVRTQELESVTPGLQTGPR